MRHSDPKALTSSELSPADKDGSGGDGPGGGGGGNGGGTSKGTIIISGGSDPPLTGPGAFGRGSVSGIGDGPGGRGGVGDTTFKGIIIISGIPDLPRSAPGSCDERRAVTRGAGEL